VKRWCAPVLIGYFHCRTFQPRLRRRLIGQR
jgi:hypothetical protein